MTYTVFHLLQLSEGNEGIVTRTDPGSTEPVIVGAQLFNTIYFATQQDQDDYLQSIRDAAVVEEQRVRDSWAAKTQERIASITALGIDITDERRAQIENETTAGCNDQLSQYRRSIETTLAARRRELGPIDPNLVDAIVIRYQNQVQAQAQTQV